MNIFGRAQAAMLAAVFVLMSAFFPMSAAHAQSAPTITSVTPNISPSTGGTTIVITGTNFVGVSRVYFAGQVNVDVRSYTVNSATQITAVTEGTGFTGLGNIAVDTPNGTGIRAFEVLPPFSVSQVTPATGTYSGGEQVTISGQGFRRSDGSSAIASVKFGGVTASLTGFNNGTQFSVTTPAVPGNSAGPVNVEVTTVAGEVAVVNNGFTYYGPPPTISTVTPSSGPTGGGTTVVITGTNFNNVTSIDFANPSNFISNPAASFTVNSPTQITAVTPNVGGGASFNAVVTVRTTGGVADKFNAFTFVPAPTISSVSPSSGDTAGGTSVTIFGSNFVAGATVTFGGVSATSVTVNGSTNITAIAPARVAGTVDVVVTTPGGTATRASAFTYAQLPTITSISPTSGSTNGGTLVTVTGTNFTNVTNVRFGMFGTSSVPHTVVSSTQITFNTPQTFSGPGAATLEIITAAGTATAPNVFTYTSPPAVPTITFVSGTSGIEAGGTRVNINGNNLSGASSVTFGGVPALVFSVTNANSITAYSPPGSGTVPIVVTTPNGSATASTQFTYTSGSAPTILGLSSSQPPSTGANVAVYGTNLVDATGVTVGGAAAAFIAVPSGTSYRLEVTVPPGTANTTVPLVVTTPRGSASTNFTYQTASTSAPTLTSVNPSSVPSAGNVYVTISGTNLATATGVSFGGAASTAIVSQGSTTVLAKVPAGAVGSVDVSVTTPYGTATLQNALTYSSAPTPVVTTVTPNFGPQSGGTSVVIRGSGFTGATSVTAFGQSQTFTVNSDTQISLTTSQAPQGGSASIVITTPGGQAFAPFTFSVAGFPAPTLASISSTSGPTAGGTSVTVVGTNFISGTVVSFGGAPAAQTIINSSTQLTAFSPAAAAGTVDVSVTTAGGTATLSNAYTYSSVATPAPTITAAAPSSGPVAGGTSVVITGTNLTGATAVGFGSTAATSFTVDSATQITAIAPAGSAGAVSIAVTTSGGTATSNNAYTYIASQQAAPTITSVTPNSGPIAGGTSVIITGTNLTGASAVSFGSTAATSFTVDSATQITAVAPAGSAGAVNIAVTTPAGTVTSNGAFTFVAPQQQAAPTTANRSGVSVAYNTATAIDLTSSITGSATGIAVATAPANGTTSVAGNIVTYTPTAGYYGADSFTFTATGPGGTSTAASVSLTVATPPAPVVAARSGVTVAFNSQGTTIDLSGSVSGVATGIAVATAPARGTASVSGNIVTYTPTAGYYGADSFTYTATGPGGTSAAASVSITVATPAAPVVAARSGVAVAFNSQGTAIDLSGSVSGVASSIAVATAPAHGTASVSGNIVTYTPTAGYYGADSFTYTATGPGGTSAAASVSLTVATPPAPVAAARSGVAVAFNSQGTAIDLSSSISGVASSISIVTPPARGTTRIAGNVVTYTPNTDTFGADSFAYTATGPGGTSAPATVSLTVAGSVPRVQPQSGSTSDGQMVSIELTRGAAIGPFTAAQVVSVSPANAATTSITSTGDGATRRYFVEATPAARFGGTVTINYTLTNAFGVSPVGVVTLTVAARPDPSNDPKVRALTDAQVQATRRFGRSQIANFMRRNEQLHSGRARSSQNISVNVIDPTRERRPEDSMAAATMPTRYSDKQEVTEAHYAAPAEQAAPADQDEKPAGVLGAMSMWVSGAIDIATRDANSFTPKLSATTSGVSGGVDFQISKRTAIGFGGGYGNVTSNINAKAAELRATSNLVAVYGSTKLFENGFVDVVAGRGFLDYKTRRRIDGTELTALGSRTGTMNLAAISFGINKQVEDLDWSFYSKLEYMDATLAAYTETSGGSRNNLRLSALDDISYSAGLGFRLQKAFATGIGIVTPRLRSEFGREFGKANVQYVDYADIAGDTSRGIQGRLNEQNFYQTSIGTMIDLKSNWSVDFEYGLTYNTATLSSGIKVQLSRAF